MLLTYDSCRYDVLRQAATPVLDSVGAVHRAQAPGNFTYASHHAFFAGILPLVVDDVPYLNRFNKQLLGLMEVGEANVAKDALRTVESDGNLLTGLRRQGWQVVGAGAMNWFRQDSLTVGFDRFRFTGTAAAAQIRFVRDEVDLRRPFFGFINFGETHAPYRYEGKRGSCPVDVRARVMKWPPVEQGLVGADCEAFAHQVEAAEFLDRQLGILLEWLPDDTVVVLCADHGECFGEDGYWGHGFNHPQVLDVPMSVFRVDGGPLP
ncbi:MAG TPA: sulfatase-like hydrolase/transferase [Acidimicrobiales bacterium]|nr:sulfatase-like hydrolase/transferase [Acidimicrobiales bacterium]